MKTGRLLKFQRSGHEVHAYLFREGAFFKAVVYVFAPGQKGDKPLHSIEGDSEAEVESAVRQWINDHFPNPS